MVEHQTIKKRPTQALRAGLVKVLLIGLQQRCFLLDRAKCTNARDFCSALARAIKALAARAASPKSRRWSSKVGVFIPLILPDCKTA